MTQPNPTVCPYLGLAADPTTARMQPTPEHRCYAHSPAHRVAGEYQAGFCLSDHTSCPILAAALEGALPGRAAAGPQPAPRGRRQQPGRARGGIRRWLPAAAVAVLALVFALVYGRDLLGPFVSSAASAGDAPPVTAEAAPPAAGAGLETPAAAAPLPTSSPIPAEPAAAVELQPVTTGESLPAATPAGRAVTLAPKAGDAGWFASGEPRGNHLGDSFLYAGYFDGKGFISAARVPLASVPRGAPVLEGRLELTGLNGERFDANAGGTWTVQLLALDAVKEFGRATFQELLNAPAGFTLIPTLFAADLAAGRTNTFALDEAGRAWLAQQVLDGRDAVIARITGPSGGDPTLFAWDSGSGPGTQGAGPRLVLSLGAPPATPPPLPTQHVIVATLTPTPATVLTAAAYAEAATAAAAATPLPYAIVTPTPLPQGVDAVNAARALQGLPPLVVYTATPANAATATADARFATAVAMTTGTFTPVPTGAVTPVVVMPTPLPENAATAIAHVLQATADAQRYGTPTPLAPGVLLATRTPTPLVVISSPTPANAATRAMIAAQATFSALTVGTYTPFPPNARTATPTPRNTAVPLLVPDTPRPTATPTGRAPAALPAVLKGKILFYSDRDGAAQLFALDPAAGRLFRVTQEWPFALAQGREGDSPDGRFRALVKMVTQVLDTNPYTGQPSSTRTGAVVAVHDNQYSVDRDLTDKNRYSYDPAWSPKGDRIAFVSTDENDEIYTIRPDGSDLQRLTSNTWEWDKHPTWSPDGKQIAFWSNRVTGRKQLWIMNADGSGQRPLLQSAYNDWDPIWVK